MRILMTGGGTAGHINPAIAIANIFKRKNSGNEILFVGTKDGLEKELVPRSGYDIEFIHAKGFKRKLALSNITTVTQFIKGCFESSKIIKNYKPDLAIGTGGYVSGAVLFCAHLHNIPVVIHESNAYAGITNRFISRYADLAYVNFENTVKTFNKAKKVIVSGNPLKNDIVNSDRESARKKLGLQKNDTYIVAMGGSRGSETLNRCLINMIKSYDISNKFKMTFATGKAGFQKAMKMMEGYDNKSVSVVPYIYNIGTHYAAADIVICRAGAMTCSEMCAMGKASIMIPSPYVTANHQEHNARSLEKKGACTVITEDKLNPKIIYDAISQFVNNPEKIVKMSMNAKKLGKLNAGDVIYKSINKYILNKKVL